MAEPNFQAEIDYWDKELSLSGVYPHAIINRSTPSLMYKEYPQLFDKYLNLLPKENAIKVLDVGSGPLSMLAYGHYKKLYDLDCVDPLADIYRKLLEKYHFEISYGMINCPGESLSNILATNSYDIVWIHNALDHSQNPETVMIEMSKVLKRGGYLCVAGWAREGTAEGFLGLHQNDLYLEDGHLVLATKGSATSKVIDSLPKLQVVEHDTNNDTREWFHIVYRKIG